MDFVRQLLLVEVALTASLGAILAIMPTLASRILGLPRPEPTLWPRLTGGLLLGISAAIALGDYGWAKQSLGLAGVIAINLCAVFVLLSVLIVGQPVPSRRGRIFLWLLTVTLFALAFVGAGLTT